MCPILNGHVQTGFLHGAESTVLIWQNIGHVPFGKFWAGLGTPRRWIDLVQQADVSLVLGEMTKQATHTHMGTTFHFLQDLSPKTWWSGWVFPQQLNQSGLHSLVLQLVNTTGYNLSEWLWMIPVISYSNQGHCWPPCSSELATQPYPGLCDTWAPEHPTQQCWDTESVERLKLPVTGWVFHVAMNSLGEVARRNTS